MEDITKRMNYFDRQFLRANDFQDEQEYHIDRRRRHNRLLHKPGVAKGLEVTGEKNANTVVVSAGTAIDIPGREIVLAEERPVPMPMNETGTKIYIEYNEVESDSSQDPGVEGKKMRITERPTFSLVPPDAKPAYGIQLADIKLSEGKLTTKPKDVREYAGILMRDLTTRSLTLECDDEHVDIDKWPKLTCSQANQAALAGDLNLDGLTLKRDDVDPGEWPRLTCSKAKEVDISGNLKVASDDSFLDFGSDTRQMINLWGGGPDASYGIGIQSGTQYYRSAGNFAWYTGGRHSDEQLDPGEGGTAVMVIKEGKVGIGTPKPTSYLSIKGNFSMNANNRLEDTASISLDGKHPGLKFHHNTTEEENAWLFLAYNNSFVLYQNNNTGVSWTAPLTILNNGNVGIGKIPDDAKLHIAGNLKLDIGEGLELLGDNDYFETNLDARIFRMIDNNGIEGNVDGGIAIEGFTPTDNARKQIMSIRGNGNVGIGKTNPESKLHVDATNRPTIMAQGNYGGLISGAGGGHGVFGTNIFIDSESQLRTAGTHTHRGGYGYSGMHTTWGNINFYALSNSNTIADAAIEPTSRLFIRGSDGHVGIGKDDPDEKLDVDGNICIRGSYTHLIGGKWEGGGVTAIHTHWIKYGESEALGFQKRESKGLKPVLRIVIGGDWTINSKIKSFLINHPLDPEHKELIHSTLEGPEIGVFYRGEAQLSNGEATVLLPDYFEALTRNENRTVLLTPKFKEDAQISMLAASGVKDGKFTVRMIDRKNPSQRFYWEVKAVRADVEILRVEQMKT